MKCHPEVSFPLFSRIVSSIDLSVSLRFLAVFFKNSFASPTLYFCGFNSLLAARLISNRYSVHLCHKDGCKQLIVKPVLVLEILLLQGS